MLAKVIPNHPLKGYKAQSFGARVTYICDKAATVALMNLAGNWADAADQMRYAALLNQRVRTPVCHIMLGWSETETPSKKDQINAAKMVLQDFGVNAHQAVIAVHIDRPSKHAHIVLNRVHPITGKALSLSNDYARLERACRRVEHYMGWPPDRGRFDIAIIDGEVELRPKPAEHWDRKQKDRASGLRPDGRSVMGHHVRTGAGYLRDSLPTRVMTQARSILDAAQHWDQVHKGLIQIGLAYTRYRSGARIKEIGTSLFMAASQLGSRYSWARMSSRLGAWLPQPKDSFIPEPQRQTVRQKQIEDLRHRQTSTRTALRIALQGKRSPVDQVLRSIMHDTHKAERSVLMHKLSQERTVPDVIPIEPDTQRYRHVTRRRNSGRDIVDDHTARRQKWVWALHNKDAHISTEIAVIIAQNIETVRADGEGGLLFAKRNSIGGLVGYEHLINPIQSPPDQSDNLHGGICTLGSPTAATCVIVGTPSRAIRHSLHAPHPAPFVIIIGDTLDPDTHIHLQDLTETYETLYIDAPDNDAAQLSQFLQTTLPQKHIKRYEQFTSIDDIQTRDPAPDSAPPDDDLPMP